MHWLVEGSGVVRAPHPSPGWGQAPALHFSFDPGLSLFGRRWLVSTAGAGIHPGSESGTCLRTNDAHRTGPSKSEQLPSVIVIDITYRQLGCHWIRMGECVGLASQPAGSLGLCELLM